MKLNETKMKKNMEKLYQTNLNKVKILSFLRFIDVILIIVFLCLSDKNHFYLILSILFIFLFGGLIIIHDNYYKKVDYYEKYLKILDTYRLRNSNQWDTFLEDGSRYCNDHNTYMQDLDIIGKHSLYQYLCSAKTLQGKSFLFQCFSNPEISQKDWQERQEVVQWLAHHHDFILEFQIYLASLEENMDLEENIEYLKKEIPAHPFLLLTILGNAVSLITLIMAFEHVLPYFVFYAVVVFKYLFSYLYGLYYKEEFEQIGVLAKNVKKLTALFQYLSKIKRENKKLKKIIENVCQSIRTIQKLDTIEGFSHLKDNFLANFIFNGIFTVDPYILFQYQTIQKQDKKNLMQSMKDISYLEGMISLANIAITKENICIPKRSNDICLEFEELTHPLLEEDVCVPNSFSMSEHIYIITGSNMSGKTSFLRTIGINLILASAGTYVCASEFHSCYLKIFTSMRIQDNIEKGISTFYGELLRIKEAIVYQKEKKPMIVLIDEIFKGTNYNDRMLGATNVIKKLNQDNVLLFITTHDFELCDTKVAKVENCYFTEFYEKDNILFDYKIRKGKCTTTNAKYLMKRLHILDEDQ